jgi:hypothetical protein
VPLGKGLANDCGANVAGNAAQATLKYEQNQVTDLQIQLEVKSQQIVELKAELLELYRRVNRSY